MVEPEQIGRNRETKKNLNFYYLHTNSRKWNDIYTKQHNFHGLNVLFFLWKISRNFFLLESERFIFKCFAVVRANGLDYSLARNYSCFRQGMVICWRFNKFIRNFSRTHYYCNPLNQYYVNGFVQIFTKSRK